MHVHARSCAPNTDDSPRRHRARRVAAGSTAAMLAVGLGLATAPAANATTTNSTENESHAAARFLSGTIGGTDLDTVVAVKGVRADNKGSKDPVTATNDLDITALSAIPLKVPGGLTVPLGDVVKLGAVNQYAQAADKGVSRAAAGAVSDAGIIDTTGGSAFPADATLSLTPLLQAPLTSVVDDVTVQLQAITGVAAADASAKSAPAKRCADITDPKNCRDYQIAGGRLNLSAPALGTLVTALNGATTQLDTAVNGLTGSNGALTTALGDGQDALLSSSALSTLLAPLHLQASDFTGGTGLTVSVNSDLTGALDGILASKLSDGVVTIDLKAGTITVDLDKLMRASTGTGLGDLAPNTEILSSKVLSDVSKRVGVLLGSLADSVNTELTSALGAVQVSIGGSLCAIGTGPDCSNAVAGTGLIVNVSGTLASLLNNQATAKVTFKSVTGSQDVDASPLLTPLSALSHRSSARRAPAPWARPPPPSPAPWPPWSTSSARSSRHSTASPR